MNKPLIAVLVLLAAAPSVSPASDAVGFINRLKAAPARVILASNTPADPAAVAIERLWNGNVCTSRLRNTATTPIRVARVDLFDLEHGLSPNTPIYGEAFQMLAQTGGTLGHPEDWGSYADRSHYKLEEPEGLRTAHGMLVLRPAARSSPAGVHILPPFRRPLLLQ